MRTRSRGALHDCGVWEALRPLRRQLAAQQNHSIYVARESKEQPLLEQLLADDPPVGGLAAYIADLNRRRG